MGRGSRLAEKAGSRNCTGNSARSNGRENFGRRKPRSGMPTSRLGSDIAGNRGGKSSRWRLWDNGEGENESAPLTSIRPQIWSEIADAGGSVEIRTTIVSVAFKSPSILKARPKILTVSVGVDFVRVTSALVVPPAKGGIVAASSAGG